MNQLVKNTDLEHKIFAAHSDNFLSLALQVFQFQYQYNPVYWQYCQLLRRQPDDIHTLETIPFLPVELFKTHTVTTTSFEPQAVFKSSGTTAGNTSSHFVKDMGLYQRSYRAAFERFYGSPKQWCILGLLPSYLEQGNSSLVAMTDGLIQESGHPLSGFYLHDWEKLRSTIMHNEIRRQPTLLLGVTYALLDFAAAYPMSLRYTTVMETGGMKGRRQEMTRTAVHELLQQQWGLPVIHSEYGMTELLSQAYSKGGGFFHCPAWMRVLLRDETDPLAVKSAQTDTATTLTGAINIIDLANLYSCSFLAVQDAGRLHSNGSFEVLGRLDNSDIRGCSLLAV